MTPICSDESTNVKFLTQQAVIAQHGDVSHYSGNMCCTASALSLQTCCQAITHFHHLDFLTPHIFLFILLCFVGVYISSTLQEANTHSTGMKNMLVLFDFKQKSTFKSLKIYVVLSFTESSRRNQYLQEKKNGKQSRAFPLLYILDPQENL